MDLPKKRIPRAEFYGNLEFSKKFCFLGRRGLSTVWAILDSTKFKITPWNSVRGIQSKCKLKSFFLFHLIRGHNL